MTLDIDFEVMRLKQLQDLSLEQKIIHSENVIKAFYEHFNGDVYVAFSGGKDSTVLLDLVRSLYPDVPAVFVNTRLEYPEIHKFVNTFNNVKTIMPEMDFKGVIEKYGYPIISKNVAYKLKHLKNPTNDNIATCRLYREGYKTRGENHISKHGKLSDKWFYLIDAPFKISNECCNIMKKKPFHKFNKESGLKPMTGEMASDSYQRTVNYYRTKCNIFGRDAMSKPLSIWTEKDIWNYILKFEVPTCELYMNGKFERTGCIFCMFGMQKETNNRFDTLKELHPKMWEYGMQTLGIQKVYDFIQAGLKKDKQLDFSKV